MIKKFFLYKTDEIILLILCMAIFLSLTLTYYKLPGISADEGRKAGLAALDILKGRGHSVCINYVGYLDAYLTIPFYKIMGINAFSFKFSGIFFPFIMLPIFYLFCRRHFGKDVASMALLLLSVNLTFVQYSRITHWGGDVLATSFVWIGFLLFGEFLRCHKAWFLFFSAFFFGVGCLAKLLALWFIPGIIVATIILSRHPAHYKIIRLRNILVALLGFLLGLSPFIIHNIQTRDILPFVQQALSNKTHLGIETFAFFRNFSERILQLYQIITLHDPQLSFNFGVDYPQWTAWLAYPLLIPFICYPLLIAYWAFQKERSYLPKDLILLLFISHTAALSFSIFPISGLALNHLIILIPGLQILTALVIRYLHNLAHKRYYYIIIVYLLLFLPTLLSHLGMNIYCLQQLITKEGGEYSEYDGNLYRLAAYLQEKSIPYVYTFTWGYADTLTFLTQEHTFAYGQDQGQFIISDAIVDLNRFRRVTDEALSIEYKKHRLKEFRIVVNHEPHNNLVETEKEIIKEWAAQNGKKLTLEKSFLKPTGTVSFLLYKISD